MLVTVVPRQRLGHSHIDPGHCRSGSGAVTARSEPRYRPSLAAGLRLLRGGVDDGFSKALQKALQQPAVLPGMELQADRTAQEKTPVLQGFSAECDVVPVALVPPQGLEP